MSVVKVSLNLGPLKAEVDLDRFIALLRDFTCIKLDDSTIAAVKEAVAQVHKGYNMIVDTLTPFYGINNERDLSSSFSEKYEKFVNVQLKTYIESIPQCYKVFEMFNKLGHNTGWKSKLPGAESKLQELLKLANEWWINDNNSFKAMKDFHDELYHGLEAIHNCLSNKPNKVCLKELQLFLSEAKPEFEKLEAKLLELDRIVAGL